MNLYWDDLIGTAFLLAFLMIPVLLPLIPGLALIAWAGRAGRARAGEGEDPGLDGGSMARSILDAAGLAGVAIVPKSAPLANFYDPWRGEIRLGPGVLDGRSSRAVGIAAHLAARAVQGSAQPRVSRLVALLRLGLRLGIGSAWIVAATGAVMLNPDLCLRGSSLELAGVLALLGLLAVDRDAHRRVVALGPIVVPPSARRAFDLAPWAEVASDLPLGRLLLPSPQGD